MIDGSVDLPMGANADFMMGATPDLPMGATPDFMMGARPDLHAVADFNAGPDFNRNPFGPDFGMPMDAAMGDLRATPDLGGPDLLVLPDLLEKPDFEIPDLLLGADLGPCTADNECGLGLHCCGGSCVDLNKDALNCGACGGACSTGATCCGGACDDLSLDVANCGTCGSACTVANGSSVCGNGQCAVGSCQFGFGDCDGVYGNGCETDLVSDVDNCRTCKNACMLANAQSSCVSLNCQIASCNAGFADCDHLPDDGCETNVAGSDVSNCGGCGKGCFPTNGTGQCVAGACQIQSCATGVSDCNGLVADGCETDTFSDIDNCGVCNHVCSFPHASVQGCLGGVCQMGPCDAGYFDCDGVASNGCESHLVDDPNSCGQCGRVCGSGVVGSPGTELEFAL